MKKILIPIFVMIFLINIINAADDDNNQLGIYCKGETREINESTTLKEDVENVCFEIKKDNIILDCDDHKIIGKGTAGTGIRVTNVYPGSPCPKNITIKNCVIKNFNKGVGICQAEGEFFNNVLKENRYGASFVIPLESTNFEFRNNILENNFKDGLIASSGQFEMGIIDANGKIIIKDNIIRNNENGAKISGVGIKFIHNTLVDNDKDAIYGENLNDPSSFGLIPHGYFAPNMISQSIISDNTVKKSERALVLDQSKNLEVSNNDFDGQDLWDLSSSRGIKGESTNLNITIRDNVIINYSTVIGGIGNIISGNHLQGGFGIHGAGSSLIKNNIITARRGMEVGNNNQIINNTLKRLDIYDFAIQIVGDSNLVEKNNILNQFGWGVKVYGDSNVLKDNVIVETIWDEIFIEGENNINENNKIIGYIDFPSSSYIRNNGTEQVFIEYKLIVEQQVNNYWVFKEKLTQSGSSGITLQPGEFYDIKEQFDNYDKSIEEPGTYRLRLYLMDGQGFVLKNSQGENIETFYYFTVTEEGASKIGGDTFIGRVWNAIRNFFS